MEKQKYYVNLTHQSIRQVRNEENEFIVYATNEEIRNLRKILNSIQSAEIDTYWRAHIPIMPYSNDPSNDRYDEALTNALKLIYELGDEQAKNYVIESGVLSDRPIDTNL